MYTEGVKFEVEPNVREPSARWLENMYELCIFILLCIITTKKSQYEWLQGKCYISSCWKKKSHLALQKALSSSVKRYVVNI